MDYDRKQERRNRWKRKKNGKRGKLDKFQRRKKKELINYNAHSADEQWALNEYKSLDKNQGP